MKRNSSFILTLIILSIFSEPTWGYYDSSSGFRYYLNSTDKNSGIKLIGSIDPGVASSGTLELNQLTLRDLTTCTITFVDCSYFFDMMIQSDTNPDPNLVPSMGSFSDISEDASGRSFDCSFSSNKYACNFTPLSVDETRVCFFTEFKVVSTSVSLMMLLSRGSKSFTSTTRLSSSSCMQVTTHFWLYPWEFKLK